jgi:hypothetical protein
MKKKFFLTLFLGTFISPVHGGDMSYEAGYATVVGVIGFVFTSASLGGWYWHYRVWKKDSAKEKARMQHEIDQLQRLLDMPVTPNPTLITVNEGGAEPQDSPPPYDAFFVPLEQVMMHDGVRLADTFAGQHAQAREQLVGSRSSSSLAGGYDDMGGEEA